jgi:hypothetical protein
MNLMQNFEFLSNVATLEFGFFPENKCKYKKMAATFETAIFYILK